MPVFAKLFLFQIALAVVVICILKVILNRQLVEFAFRELDAIRPVDTEDLERPVDLVVTAHKQLKTEAKQKLQKIAHRVFGADVKISLKESKELWGGVILQYSDKTINYSLVNRLKESGFIK